MKLRAPWGVAALALLLSWAALAHPRFGHDAIGGSAVNTTSSSTSSSSETQTTTETVRIDTFATRIIAVDGIGGVAADTTLPKPFADAVVQSAVDAAEAALLTGPPVSLFIKGPVLIDSVLALVDSSTETTETGRETNQVATAEVSVGPACIGTGDRDVPNTAPCTSCSNIATVPPGGTPTCVPAGTVNTNIHTDDHTVIQELETTTETYQTTETYVLHGSFLDHFLFYKVKGSATAPKLVGFGPVTLTDALGTVDYDVAKLPALGIPADKNGEGRADATTSIAQYAVKRSKGAPKFAKIADVTTQNQCGALTLTLTKPESLLVPVARQATPFDPLSAEVDHLLCYKAKSLTKLAKGTQVDVADDFQTRRYDLKKATRLCLPASTAGTPDTKKGVAVPIVATARRHPAGHLVCYQAKIASKRVEQNGCGPVDPKSKGTKIVPKPAKHQKQLAVAISGPLGTATLDTAKEVELCIPSMAIIP